MSALNLHESRGIGTVSFKLGTRRVHQERNKMTSVMWLTAVSFYQKPNISICNLLKWGRRSCPEQSWLPYCNNSPCQLWISVLIKKEPAAKLLSLQQHHRRQFVSFLKVFPEIFSIQYFTVSVEYTIKTKICLEEKCAKAASTTIPLRQPYR